MEEEATNSTYDAALAMLAALAGSEVGVYIIIGLAVLFALVLGVAGYAMYRVGKRGAENEQIKKEANAIKDLLDEKRKTSPTDALDEL